MKLFFTKEDSLYKIIKALEKLPKGKSILLHIDHENNFYDHPRWGNQVKTILEEKDIPYTCVSQHPSTKKYFSDIGMPCAYEPPNRILHSLHMAGLFLFNIKKFHVTVFTKKNALSYFFIVGEIIGIIAILYIMYQFLVPSATVLLQPAYTVEDVVYNFRYYPHTVQKETMTYTGTYIAIPYEDGSYVHTQTLSVPVSSLQYLSRPSAGTLVVSNTLPTKYTLKVGTKFITEKGQLFTADAGFVLSPGSRQVPSQTTVRVTAMDKDIHGEIIGENGNILSGERLLIKNLNQSAVLGAIEAHAQGNFVGGYTRKGGVVAQQDLDVLQNKLLDQLGGTNKKIIVKKNFTDENAFLLPWDDLIQLRGVTVTFNAKVGDTVDTLEAKATATYTYPYVIWNNLLDAVREYVTQRPSHTRQLISLQKNTTTFYDSYSLDNMMVVPTKVSAVRGYDFDKDTNGLLEEMKLKIAGVSVTDAKKILVGYPEVSAVVIKTSPAWSDSLPTLMSRIYFRTTHGN